jgi:hypothetical protein
VVELHWPFLSRGAARRERALGGKRSAEAVERPHTKARLIKDSPEHDEAAVPVASNRKWVGSGRIGSEWERRFNRVSVFIRACDEPAVLALVGLVVVVLAR